MKKIICVCLATLLSSTVYAASIAICPTVPVGFACCKDPKSKLFWVKRNTRRGPDPYFVCQDVYTKENKDCTTTTPLLGLSGNLPTTCVLKTN